MRNQALWGISALLLLPGAVEAQDRSSPPATAPTASIPLNPIIVTGRSAPIRKRVEALQHAVTPYAAADEPLPRFSDPVCFAAAGLDRATLEPLSDRVVEDAAQAGLGLAGEGCRPNVTLLFVDGVEAVFARLRRRDPACFGYRTR